MVHSKNSFILGMLASFHCCFFSRLGCRDELLFILAGAGPSLPLPFRVLLPPQEVLALSRAGAFFTPRSTVVSLPGPAWSLSSETSNPICQDTIVSLFSYLTALNSMPRRLGNSLNLFHVQADFAEKENLYPLRMC